MLLYDVGTQGADNVIVPADVAGDAAQTLSVEVLQYAVGATAFAILALLLLLRSRRTLPGILLTVACGSSAAWLGTAAAQVWGAGRLREETFAIEAVAGCAWLAFLAGLLWTIPDSFVRRHRTLLFTGGGLFGVGCLVVVVGYLVHPPQLSDALFMAFRLIIIVASFILLENIVRNTHADHWWSLKFLSIGLGAVLTYDLFLYADGLMFSALSKNLVGTRGAVYAVTVPLLFIATMRRQMWQEKILLSHKSAFYSSAIIVIGAYLTVMALAAYYIRQLGGTWGPVVQVFFLFGAAVTIIVVVFSGSLRAALRVVVAKHFYRYKYDYRDEWLRFTRTLSETQSGSPVGLRIAQAIAAVVDSTGAALWLRDGSRFTVATTYNARASSLAEQDVQSLAEFMTGKGWIINLEEWRQCPERYVGLNLPPTVLAIERGWIIVPLLHRAELIAFALLLRPRAPRVLDWEDFDLLKLIGRHAASFLAEQQAIRALTEAHQFDRFNRRTAFIMHDIKNVVSQLSLIAGNIPRHGDKPAFREDLAMAINQAVGRMKQLLECLRDDGVAKVEPVAIKAVLQNLVAMTADGRAVLEVEANADALRVPAQEERLRAMVSHLLQNAVEATDDGKRVCLSLGRSRDNCLIEVSDDGTGMTPAFVADELFKPFRSTKSSGLGIGAYQCREYARELGGDIEVISSPGAGTTMRIVLPLAEGGAEARPLGAA